MLVQHQPVNSVTCDACFEAHTEAVEFVQSSTGPARAYITCPQAGRVPVDVSRLAQWQVDPATIAAALASAIRSREGVREFVHDRLWDIGRCDLGDARWGVLMGVVA